MPTEFGPVSLRVKLASRGSELKVQFSGRYRERPAKVVLHVPPVPGLKKITLNGKPLAWDGKSGSIVLK